MTDSNDQPDLDRRGVTVLDQRTLLRILIAAIIGSLAALAVSVIVPREYSASVSMLPARSERPDGLAGIAGQFGGLASLAGLEFGGDDDKNEAVATLRSKSLVVDFIKERNLLPVIFANKWDSSSGKWRVDDPDDVPTLNDAYRKFNGRIRSVAEDRRTGLVTLTITWRSPRLAAAWANELAAQVNREMSERAIREARGSLRYLDRELQKTEVLELREPIYRLMANRINNVMMANVREQYAFRIIDPAVPPDLDDYSRPLHWLFALAGAALGGLIGAVLSWWQKAKMRHAD